MKLISILFIYLIMSYLDEIKSLQTIINEYNELKNIYPNIDK